MDTSSERPLLTLAVGATTDDDMLQVEKDRLEWQKDQLRWDKREADRNRRRDSDIRRRQERREREMRNDIRRMRENSDVTRYNNEGLKPPTAPPGGRWDYQNVHTRDPSLPLTTTQLVLSVLFCGIPYCLLMNGARKLVYRGPDAVLYAASGKRVWDRY